MTLIERILEDAEESRKQLNAAIKLYEDGTVKTRKWGKENEWIDTTQEDIDRCRKSLGDMVSLLSKYADLKDRAE